MFFIGGNWKMNGDPSLLSAFAALPALPSGIEVVIFPPAPLLAAAQSALSVPVGAQNCFHGVAGAFTGEISPRLLSALEIKWVLLGHSERRKIFSESDALIASKLESALKENLKVIFCVGESLEERESGEMEAVLKRQLSALPAQYSGLGDDQLIIAYEPVWAIGTGKVATPEQARDAHHFIRTCLIEQGMSRDVRIIYGGSVTAGSAKEMASVEGVDGFLVGGASLKVEEFSKIIAGAQQCHC
jgi:triosephosphate isomerase